MSERWEQRIETDNRGKPLMVWCWDEYELCENANLGLEGGWVFELTCKGFRVDLAPTMKGGKQLARDHAVRAEVKPRELVEQEQES